MQRAAPSPWGAAPDPCQGGKEGGRGVHRSVIRRGVDHKFVIVAVRAIVGNRPAIRPVVDLGGGGRRDGRLAMARDGSATVRSAVTAFFDDRAAAQQAVDDLVAAKVARERITLVEGGATPMAVEPVPTRDRSVWDTVKDLFMADVDRHAYGEGLRRGGFLVSVMLGAGDAARVVEVLDREGAVDMDARQSDWELEGWDPVRASADLDALASAAPSAAPVDGGVRAAVEPSAAVGPAFGKGEAPRPGSGRVVRDVEAEGLRLRTYVESHAPPDPAR